MLLNSNLRWEVGYCRIKRSLTKTISYPEQLKWKTFNSKKLNIYYSITIFVDIPPNITHIVWSKRLSLMNMILQNVKNPVVCHYGALLLSFPSTFLDEYDDCWENLDRLHNIGPFPIYTNQTALKHIVLSH